MPEIWLRYGTTDVVLDIKFENLLAQLSSNFKTLTEEEVGIALDSVPVSENMLIVVLTPSKSSAKVVTFLMNKARSQGLSSITVDVVANGATLFRSYLGEGVSINRIDYQSMHDRIKKFQSAVLISHTAYDPLFGFAGSPTILLRNFFPLEMSQAFRARQGNRPAAGVSDSPPLKIALASTGNISAYCIEIVADNSGIAGIHTGNISEAFLKAIAQLSSISVVESDPARSAIFSASSEAIPHLTLASSLNSLWNNIHIVKEGGSAVLLAENRGGVGGGSLQMFIEGRLKPEQLHQTLDAQYIDGMEHLLYIEEMRQKYDLGIVSTLPQYYSKTKLGFATYAGMRDVLEKLLARNGKSHKILIVSEADVIYLRPKAQGIA